MLTLTIKRTTTTLELEQVYHLRYQVYCIERGFEPFQQYPNNMESDEYDAHSIHILAMTNGGYAVGTVRLVLDSSLGFPIEKHYGSLPAMADIPKNKIAEISRLAVSKVCCHMYLAKDWQSKEENNVCDEKTYRQYLSLIARGVFAAMWKESKRLELDYWCCAMERCLFVLLKRSGISFTRIGPEVEYHGLRAPYLACIQDIESNVMKNTPQLYELVSANRT